ncbi:WHG domain-containing protein [Microbacterium sp. LRZ72]|uniref:TetR/AcrR family transcriptional regulator n=1 Tax=Microbacterium sp. LRZ72 TaxID=2942481 RepID=UPI0029A3DCAA|nr:TetR/AcrR family transcriptional regulator [Microbacterium sp. LRZ72]MDX2377226.1 WHG domain-containing protein [Microbacterium sp. LRZ72]
MTQEVGSHAGAAETADRAYHHGDLRQALIDAGLSVTRVGGVDALSLRELTRAVGVSPNAAYRHFADRDALVHAVANGAQQQLAGAIAARIAAAPASDDAAVAATERLRRIGLAYIDFARAEPGWFSLAFQTQDETASEGIVTIDDEVVAPFQLLLDALDQMVDAGALEPARRPYAEWACWASVHGFADIAAHGPLQWQPAQVVDALAASVVESAITGVRGTPAPPGASLGETTTEPVQRPE